MSFLVGFLYFVAFVFLTTCILSVFFIFREKEIRFSLSNIEKRVVYCEKEGSDLNKRVRLALQLYKGLH